MYQTSNVSCTNGVQWLTMTCVRDYSVTRI